jgi:uncharacterized protein YndB with AHSA1/START domain
MADLRHQIAINAAPAKVYEALTSQAGLRAWWTADAATENNVGSKAQFGFNKRRTVFHMTIETLEPGRRVVWSCQGEPPEWNGTILTWDLAGADCSTVVRFNHAGWRAETDLYAICNSSWGELMHRLKDYVEGRKPGPHWKE